MPAVSLTQDPLLPENADAPQTGCAEVDDH